MIDSEDRLRDLEARVSLMEGNLQQIDARLGSIENRLNTQIQITIAMWVTTMAAVITAIVAIFART